jgi:2-aminoadipate transaminase
LAVLCGNSPRATLPGLSNPRTLRFIPRMTLDVQRLFSVVAGRLRASEIRELLKLLDRPEMISFAGGLPNPAAFPIQSMQRIVSHVMQDHASDALQYGPTEGHFRLRSAIAKGMSEHYGAPQNEDNILITTGSQQALSLLCTVLLDPDDIVLTASPTYLGALLTFNACRARVQGLPTDAEGVIPEALDEQLRSFGNERNRAKMIYLVPTFDNPTGRTMGYARRQQIYEIACRYDLLIVEDDPYGLLRYEGAPIAPIKSLDIEGRVAYLGSFSKILAPGFRVGWLAAEPTLIRKAVLAKQAQDICTTVFGQYCVFEAMVQDMLFNHIDSICTLYRAKRDLMLKAMQDEFPSAVKWNRPSGGLFLWLELPTAIDATELLSKAIAHNVAYVTGKPFFPDGTGDNTLRLNFSYAKDEDIVEGIKRLSKVVEAEIASVQSGTGVDRMPLF